MTTVNVSADGPPIEARVMLDGTLRSLAVLTALESVEPGSRIIVRNSTTACTRLASESS
jgi:hypothetical protein